MKIYNTTIIGAGPAGLATTLQLKRHGIDPLLLERGVVGGLLHNANRVENYPGFPSGISGPDLVRLFAEHAEHAGIEVTHEEVLCLDFQEGIFHISGRSGTFRSRVVVVATGTRPEEFLDSEIPEDIRENVLYEVYPLISTVDKQIVIVGAGDAAFDYALNLASVNHITILNRGTERKCLPLLWERVQSQKNISYRENVAVDRIARGDLKKIKLICGSPAGELRMECDYLIGAIGRVPRLDFISENMQDRIKDLEKEGRLYFIGDVTRGLYRQTAIAVGDGIRTAMTISDRQKGQPA
jgi:thioredoxin reductase